MILFSILAVLVLVSLFAIVRVMCDIAADLKGLDEPPQPTTEERKNEKIRQEIEKRRDGK